MTDFLLSWAYLGHLPSTLSQLRGLALREDWEFKNTVQNPNRPHPILRSYLLRTFQRLILEKKVAVNEGASVAAFNTGLVDPRYEAIYALFGARDDQGVVGTRRLLHRRRGAGGQRLVRYFNPLPSTAHYFRTSPAELLGTRLHQTKRSAVWQLRRDVVIERIDRYPKEFIEDNWPSGFQAKRYFAAH